MEFTNYTCTCTSNDEKMEKKRSTYTCMILSVVSISSSSKIVQQSLNTVCGV